MNVFTWCLVNKLQWNYSNIYLSIYLSDAYMFTGNLFSVCIAPEYSLWESNAVVVCGGGMNKKTGAIYRGKIMWHWRLLLWSSIALKWDWSDGEW